MPAFKTCFVINPFAASGKIVKRWPAIEGNLKQTIGSFEAVFTQYPNHATHLTRDAISRGFDRIVAVGGDGTLSQVINGFFSDDGHTTSLNPDAVLGFLGVGTGCDTAKSLGLGKNIDEQIKTLAEGKVNHIDLGRVETTEIDGSTKISFFINMCSFGLSAEIVSAVNRTSLVKAISGRFAYLLGALRALLTNKNQNICFKINDGLEIEQKVALIAVANGAFCGGGVHLAPMAIMNDAKLDAIIVGNVGFLDLLRYMRKLFKGKHLSHPKITHQPLAKLTAHSCGEHNNQIPVEADGEFIGYLPCNIDVLPKAILVQTN